MGERERDKSLTYEHDKRNVALPVNRDECYYLRVQRREEATALVRGQRRRLGDLVAHAHPVLQQREHLLSLRIAAH